MNTVDPMERIVKVRKYKEIKQSEIAELLGISKSAWSSKERGNIAGFSLLDIQKIIDFLNVDARWIFGQINCNLEDAILDREYTLKYDNQLVAEKTNHNYNDKNLESRIERLEFLMNNLSKEKDNE